MSAPGCAYWRELTVEEWNENDERDGVQVLEKIIWRSVQRHLAGLGDEIVPYLNPAYEVERKEQEDLM
jgi:hypothetical protein